MDDDEDTLLLADISDCPAAVPSESPRTSNLSWVNNKIILGSKPNNDPNKSPPQKPDNVIEDNDSTPQKPEVSNNDNVCKHCNVKFANSDSLITHLMEVVAAKNKPVKRKIEPTKDGKECQITKKSKASKVVKRRREERISEARDRDIEASTSKIHSTHHLSSTNSHENVKKSNKTYTEARELQVEASTSSYTHSTHQISSTALAHGQTSNKTSKANSNEQTDRRNENMQQLNYYYKCKNCNKHFVHEHDVKQHTLTDHPGQKHMFEKIQVNNIRVPVKLPLGLDGGREGQKVSSEDIPKKNSKIDRNRDHEESATKRVSFRPEFKELLSLQNKPSSSWEPNIVNQNLVVNTAKKKSTSSKRALKNHPTKIIKKARFSNCLNRKPRAPRKVTSAEKIKLFKSSCGLHFTSYESIQNHDDECNGSCDTPKSTCIICGYLFPTNSLLTHQSEHHDNNNKIYFDVVKLSRKSILQCTTCEKKFTYKKAFQTHVLQCTYKIKPKNFNNLKVLYKCPPCNIHYRTPQGLKVHCDRDHSDSGRIQKCDACNILLIGQAFTHHMEIQHKVMEYELKDLCIKYAKNNNSRTQTNNKTIGKLLHNNDETMKNTSHGSVTRPTKSTDLNMEHPNYQNQSLYNDENPSNKTTTNERVSKVDELKEKANDNIISTTSEMNKGSYKTTVILPHILYKCKKCEVHFVTSSALKNHISHKNCPDISNSEIDKCPKCQLVFYTVTVIEHLANQHIGRNLKTSNDFIIVCSDNVEIQSYDTPSNENGNITKESMRATKSLTNPDEGEEPASKKITFETTVDNYQKYDNIQSVKSFADAWIRKTCAEISHFATINLDSYSTFLYRCHKCFLNFLNSGPLKMHLSTCDGEIDEWIQCPICSYSFSISSLTLHVYVHHAKLELKRENFEIISSESCLNSPTIANDSTAAKEQYLKTPQILNSQGQRANALENSISKNNPDVTQEVSEVVESGLSVVLNQRYETKDTILSNFKSSRAKIAWAIENIEYANNGNDIKPSVEINEANSISNKEVGNDDVITKNDDKVDSSSNLLKKDILNETFHMSTFAVNPIDKPNDQITEYGEDVQTDKLFEDIDTLVASFDSNVAPKVPKRSKKRTVLFKCHICTIHFMTKKSLKSHISNRNHYEDGKKCKYCKLIFHKYTIKRHTTNHHEKYNQPAKYSIKTLAAERPVISEFFKENQKGNIDLTQIQKSNMNKLPKNLYQTNLTETNVEGLSNQTNNAVPIQMLNDPVNSEKHNNVDNYFSNNKNVNPQNNDHNMKLADLSNPSNVATLAEDSINNNADIIDLCNSQSVGPEGDIITDAVTSFISCTKDSQYPKNRNVSVNSNNNHNDNLAKETKRQTKSQDQREFKGQKQITSNHSKRNKTVTININSGINEKHEKDITIVENNINRKSELSVPPYFQLNGTDIIPINPKARPDIKTKGQPMSVIQTPIKHVTKQPTPPKRYQTENIQEQLLKQSYSNKATSSTQKSQRPPFITFEDSNFEIRATYENIDNTHKIHEEYSKQQEKLKRKRLDNPTDHNEFLNGFATPTFSSTDNTPQKDPLDIIDITEETNNNTEMPKKNSTINSNAQHSRLPNIAFEKNMNKVFGIQNRRKSIATIGSDMPNNTPVATPQLTTNNNTAMPMNNSTVQHGRLPNIVYEQHRNTAFGIQNRRKSIATIGSDMPNNTPVATPQPATNNRTVQHGRLPNVAFEQNRNTAFGIQNRRESIATNGSGMPNNIPAAPSQPVTNNNTKTPMNNRTVQHGRLPNISFEQNRNTACGVQYRRESNATIGSGMPNNIPVAPPQPANFNLSNIIDNLFLRNLALLQSLPFQQPGLFNVQNQPKTNQNQNKKREAKTQKVPGIFDRMTSCPICRCNDRLSTVRKHLRVRRGFFYCCFCAHKSADSELEKHIQNCGSRLNFSI